MIVSATIERALQDGAFPVRGGVFVAVTGPSGSGKDTLIAHARARLGERDGVLFVRRIITRPVDPRAEDHDVLGEEAFEAALAAGRMSLSWRANGLSYGLPIEVDAVVGSGQVAVANISRGAVPALRARYANTVLVCVTAPAQVLARRLAARGRESEDQVRERLERHVPPDPDDGRPVVIDNGGAPEEAGERLVAVIRKAAAFAALDDTM